MRHPDQGRVTVKQTNSRISKPAAIMALVLLALGVTLALSLPDGSRAIAQQAGQVQSLRGETAIPDESLAPEIQRQDTPAGVFSRAYRQQPPLIPHRIEGYQISRTVNQCMQCHDWPYNVDEGAPKISETHYFNRDGIALDQVTPGRWFCTQCHVPQVNARELVKNDFKSAKDLDQ